MAADYKATRSPMPPDLVEQVPYVHEVCAALGVPILTYERYEADDVLATLALTGGGGRLRGRAGHRRQGLLPDGRRDRIKVYNPKDDGTWFDPDGVVTKFGVRPDQVVDVLALMGDSIDNVKGVPGIGEKGARDLIATHGSLDALLENAATITQKRYREALLANADQARQSRELVRLHTDVPVEFNPDDCKYAGANAARCFELFSKFGFRSLVMEYAPTAQTVTKDYAAIDSLDGAGSAREGSARGGRGGDAPRDRYADRDARGNRRRHAVVQGSAGALRAARARRRPRRASCRCRRHPRRICSAIRKRPAASASASAAATATAATGTAQARDLFSDTETDAPVPVPAPAPAKKRGAPRNRSCRRTSAGSIAHARWRS